MTDRAKEDKDQGLEQTETVENPVNEGDENKESASNVSNETDQAEGAESDKLARENQELKDKYVRLYSEFENFRRRTAKERLELVNTASKDLMQEVLPILDDFERSFKAENASDPEEEQKQAGSKLIYNKLLRVLTAKGLQPMEDLVGKDFDAEYHEAITQIPAPSEELKGKIVDVVEKGYTMAGKVVRFAKVVIGN
ncbi:molecular chaperone GrpE [Cyclobacterium xiamenense]|uniref:Protein GrpE n=1 Tax=Cyclobacterium xiamenense TaxID=1297121 RepID=A0A1H6XYK6_9BACT|nr:nucleotide exchange factor GrpE [Cyclobacterium xiamenense]SEJ33266.1 molecular chaperone GrpE [Cyclobacterium xiamenense]